MLSKPDLLQVYYFQNRRQGIHGSASPTWNLSVHADWCTWKHFASFSQLGSSLVDRWTLSGGAQPQRGDGGADFKNRIANDRPRNMEKDFLDSFSLLRLPGCMV